MDKKSNDQDYDILSAVLVELHIIRLPCEMENEGTVHGKASSEGEVEIAYQFCRNLALLPHVRATFPDLALLSSLILSNTEVLSRNIRDSMR